MRQDSGYQPGQNTEHSVTVTSNTEQCFPRMIMSGLDHKHTKIDKLESKSQIPKGQIQKGKEELGHWAFTKSKILWGLNGSTWFR